MDREILFRGKRLDNGKWVEGSLLVYADGDMFICCEDYIPCVLNKYEVAPTTVGQYTGLTDKNGKKIFEGDIVAAGYYKWKCQVVWDEEGARFICYTLEGERRIVYVDMVDKYDKSALEVIGNIHDIHDNPELMGGEGDG